MDNGSISQNELDALFGNDGGLEAIDELEPLQEERHIWIIKDITTGGVCGGRCWTAFDAQSLLLKAQKDYPDNKFEIRQVK